MNRIRLRLTLLLLWAAACVLLLPACGCAGGQSPPVNSPSSAPVSAVSTAPPEPATPGISSPSPGAPKGIDPDKFIPAAEAYVRSLEDENGAGTLTAEISVTHIIGFVDITFTELTVWTGFTDAEKKDYITALGKALDRLASESIYPGTGLAVGTDTVLHAPDGRELAERTSLGIIKLY